MCCRHWSYPSGSLPVARKCWNAASVVSAPAVLVPKISAIRSGLHRPRSAANSDSRLRTSCLAMRVRRVDQGPSSASRLGRSPWIAPTAVLKGTATGEGPSFDSGWASELRTSSQELPSALLRVIPVMATGSTLGVNAMLESPSQS